jgi:alpha-amylase
MRKILSFLMTIAIIATVMTVAPVAASAQEAEVSSQDDKSTSTVTSASDFSWDNASVYFLLTDRFYNGNTSNDHSYERGLEQDGSVTKKMKSNAASFQGGDFAGITKKITEGYFDDLGVNALWISAPYEQIQGYCCCGNSKKAFPHYAYHGYYAGDYSNFDQNFGTAEEFQTMVDTAHSHGIRIVLDVVMNHPGYNTIYDMNKFGFGKLQEYQGKSWEEEYYSFSGNNNTYHQYIVYTDTANKSELDTLWGNWWGASWLRAGLSGYSNFGSGDKLSSAGGELPDFKTESTEEVSVPTFLQTKWTQEGNYDQKMSDLDSWFTSNNKDKTVRNYLCYWLSQYVEKYGVDGFRCDTAKHVELESWATLKETCSKALATWRQNNPTKAGADWDEDFWMTGEVYGKTLTTAGANDEYYKDGKFDSTINFGCQGGVVQVSSLNSTYEKYASYINGDDKEGYNVLTYISSHDTTLSGRNTDGTHDSAKLIYQGSALQLLPGAIQIFYGDETGREYVTNSDSSILSNIRSGNHDVRLFMNWESEDKEVLAHWQKVGTFRSNHIAVGAGSHKSLTSTSGAAFERLYNKNNVSDKVLCVVGADANKNVTITVDTENFPNGTILTNTYDGKTATVSNGKVTFNSGENGTVLCEATGFDKTVKVTSVKLNATAKTVKVKASFTLKAVCSPSNASNKAVTWTTSKSKVATVSTSGKVTAKSAGVAYIKATAKDGSKKYAQCKVTVKQPVTKVTLKQGSKSVTNKTIKIKRNKTVTLKAVVSPTNASVKTVSWSTSNKKVATVTSKGKVKVLKNAKIGKTAVIKVMAKDGSKKSAKCTVKVIK